MKQGDVPDNAIPYDDASEVPEGARTVEGPRGGTYYIPPDEDPSDEDRELPESGTEHNPNPDEDIPNFRDNEDVDEALERVNSEPMEGFTLNRDLSLQPLGSEDTWVVGALSEETTEPLSKDEVIEVYEELQEVLGSRGIRIGTYQFEEGDRWSIDVSLAVTDDDTARELGEQLNQESVFHMGDQSLEFTGGDGDSPINSVEELKELLEEVDTDALSEKEVLPMLKDNVANRELIGVDSGDAMTVNQILRAAVHGDIEAEQVDPGNVYIVDGERFEPPDSSE